jgi:hypothetical protein
MLDVVIRYGNPALPFSRKLTVSYNLSVNKVGAGTKKERVALIPTVQKENDEAISNP